MSADVFQADQPAELAESGFRIYPTTGTTLVPSLQKHQKEVPIAKVVAKYCK